MNKLNILVLIPVKPNLHPALKAICFERGMAVQTALGGTAQVVFDSCGAGDQGVVTLEERVAHTVKIRNHMVEEYLRPDHTHVVWVDADIVTYGPMLPMELAIKSIAFNAVTAPAVYLHGHTLADYGRNITFRRWYDTAGFVKHDKPFRIGFPYYNGMELTHFEQSVECEGVGCFYCVPARVYHAGAKHEPRPGFTDHLAICQFAKGLGCSVLCDFTKFVEHAYLKDYGEALH